MLSSASCNLDIGLLLLRVVRPAVMNGIEVGLEQVFDFFTEGQWPSNETVLRWIAPHGRGTDQVRGDTRKTVRVSQCEQVNLVQEPVRQTAIIGIGIVPQLSKVLTFGYVLLIDLVSGLC